MINDSCSIDSKDEDFNSLVENIEKTVDYNYSPLTAESVTINYSSDNSVFLGAMEDKRIKILDFAGIWGDKSKEEIEELKKTAKGEN